MGMERHQAPSHPMVDHQGPGKRDRMIKVKNYKVTTTPPFSPLVTDRPRPNSNNTGCREVRKCEQTNKEREIKRSTTERSREIYRDTTSSYAEEETIRPPYRLQWYTFTFMIYTTSLFHNTICSERSDRS